MKSFVLTAALCAITSFIAAQKLVGTWVNDDFALQYEFYQNGNYSLTSKDYGNFSGTYNYFKQTISLFDFQGNLTVQYFVQQHTANRLSLVDGNNFAFVLQRKEQVTTSVGMEAFSAARYPRVLAEKGNQKILEADARLYTAAISFLVQDQLNESHYQEIEKALITDFNKNPKAAMNDLAGLRQGMEYIFTLHDPMEIGIVRQRILGAVYYGSVVQHQPNAYWNITDRFIDVIAYDPTNFLVLTTEDLNDYLDYLAFSYQLYGQELGEQEKAALGKRIASEFSTYSLEDKQLLANAGLLYDFTRAQYESMSAGQQQQWQSSMQESAGNLDYDWDREDLDADVIQFMSEMNQMSHVSMMNVIENMGGGYDYWELKETDANGNVIW